MANSFGRRFNITLFGESHGKGIGVVLNGCPSGIEIDEEFLQKEADRRRPGQSAITTARQEKDQFQILSGVFNHTSTGAPITFFIPNEDTKSQDYDAFRKTPRPSQSDYPAFLRFGSNVDIRGSGIFSGRITAGIVLAGAIAKMILQQLNVKIGAYVSQIGLIQDSQDYTVDQILEAVEANEIRTVDPLFAEEMIKLISTVQSEEDSIGGKVNVQVENFPAGIGDPWFHSIKADLAAALMAIPATRGIEFGSGFEAATMRGSEHNDAFHWENGKIITKSNHAGGMIGGISIGTPILFQVAIKPTASIAMEQETVDLESETDTTLKVTGRHDPSIVPRALVAIEAMTAIVLVDQLLNAGAYEIPPRFRK